MTCSRCERLETRVAALEAAARGYRSMHATLRHVAADDEPYATMYRRQVALDALLSPPVCREHDDPRCPECSDAKPEPGLDSSCNCENGGGLVTLPAAASSGSEPAKPGAQRHTHIYDGQGLCPCGADMLGGRSPVHEVSQPAEPCATCGGTFRLWTEEAGTQPCPVCRGGR